MAWVGAHVLAQNNAEGGSNNTTVTTGNSGGTSGNPWDGITISGSSTLVYTSTSPISGDLSYLLTADGAAVAAFWNASGALGSVRSTGKFCFAGYFNHSAWPASGSPILLVQEDAGGGARVLDVRTSVSGVPGRIRLAGANQSAIVDLSTAPMALNTSYRIEVEIDYTGGGNPGYWIAFFEGHSTTPIQQASGTSSNIGSQVGRVTVGRVQSPDYTMRFDNVGIGTDRLGPYETPTPEPSPGQFRLVTGSGTNRHLLAPIVVGA